MKRVRSEAKITAHHHSEHHHLPLEDTRVHAQHRRNPDGQRKTWEDRYLLYPDLKILARSQDCFRKIEMDHCLSLALPKPGSTPGSVLNHCIKTIEKLYAEKKPMTFKIGFTHDPAVRWHNSVFGYKGSKDPFDYMIVLYGAANPHGPAFLEAALINHFGGYLFASMCLIVLKLVIFWFLQIWFVLFWVCVCVRTCPNGGIVQVPDTGYRFDFIVRLVASGT